MSGGQKDIKSEDAGGGKDGRTTCLAPNDGDAGVPPGPFLAGSQDKSRMVGGVPPQSGNRSETC